jgi:hypothetical protein
MLYTLSEYDFAFLFCGSDDVGFVVDGLYLTP